MSDPKVSLIIVNWNGKELLQTCLSSIYKQSYSNFEIIVVDNASSDNSVDFLKIEYPTVKIISLDSNRGFAGGNNVGLKHAIGEYIALINTDVELHESWLKEVVAAMSRNEHIGICASRILVSRSDIIDSVGELYTTAFTSVKLGEHDHKDSYAEPIPILGASAAAALYRKSMLDIIGFFDEEFFLNYEDTDLHIRAWLAGWKCSYVPGAIAYHGVSRSLGRLGDLGVYYLSRNSEWMWIKNTPFTVMIRFLHHRIMAELFAFIYFCVVKHKWKAFLQGKLDALKKIPFMLHERKKVQKLIILPYSEINRNLMPFSRYFWHRITTLNFAFKVK